MTTWTRERPAEPGWYWFDPDDETPDRLKRLETIIVQLQEHADGLYIRQTGAYFRLHEVGGRFAGPLKMPEGGTPVVV